MLTKLEIVPESEKVWDGSDNMSTQLDLLAKSQVNLDILGCVRFRWVKAIIKRATIKQRNQIFLEI